MTKRIFTCAIVMMACHFLYALTPSLSVLTNSLGEEKIAVASVRSITYDKTTGKTMYIHTTTGTKTYMLSDIVRMTLVDIPIASALPTISQEEARDAQKILVNGTIYVIRDGRVFTIEGKVLK